MRRVIGSLLVVAACLIGMAVYLSIPSYPSVCVQPCLKEGKYFKNVVESTDRKGNRVVIIYHQKQGHPAHSRHYKVGLDCINTETFTPLLTWNVMEISDVGSYTPMVETFIDLSYKVNLQNQAHWILKNLPISKDHYYAEYDQIIFRLTEPPPERWGAEVRFEWELGKSMFQEGLYENTRCMDAIYGKNGELLEYVEF